MLRDGHKDEIKAIPAVASAVSLVELALSAPRENEVRVSLGPVSYHVKRIIGT